MKEKDLIKLGFEKEIDESDAANPFYYYILDVTPGLTFISNASDEVDGDNWFVEFFDTEIPVRYHEYKRVKSLFAIISLGLIHQSKLNNG